MLETIGIVIAGIVVAMVVYFIGYASGRGATIDEAEAKIQPLSPHKKCFWCRQVRPDREYMGNPHA
jgi:hypothetical protein